MAAHSEASNEAKKYEAMTINDLQKELLATKFTIEACHHRLSNPQHEYVVIATPQGTTEVHRVLDSVLVEISQSKVARIRDGDDGFNVVDASVKERTVDELEDLLASSREKLRQLGLPVPVKDTVGYLVG